MNIKSLSSELLFEIFNILDIEELMKIKYLNKLLYLIIKKVIQNKKLYLKNIKLIDNNKYEIKFRKKYNDLNLIYIDFKNIIKDFIFIKKIDEIYIKIYYDNVYISSNKSNNIDFLFENIIKNFYIYKESAIIKNDYIDNFIITVI